MEDKIQALLKNTVDESILPVLEKAYPDIFPSITFHLYNEGGALFGSGNATEESASCQIDIWYKVKKDNIKAEINKIKQAIINEKYFSHPTKETVIETGTKIYHTYIIFELLETEE